MDIQTFNILVFRQKRLLISVLIFALTFLCPLLISTEIDNLILKLSFLLFSYALIIGTLVYFPYGRLIVSTDGEQIEFHWKEKILFKYRNIESIKLKEIEKIVLDEGQILRTIYTKNEVIQINNNRPNKQFKSDSQKFISFLLNQQNEAKVIDSWDEFDEKGFLKMAYRINTAILIIAVIVMTSFIVFKGFNSRHLFFLLAIIPQMFLYQKQMRVKLKRQKK